MAHFELNPAIRRNVAACCIVIAIALFLSLFFHFFFPQNQLDGKIIRAMQITQPLDHFNPVPEGTPTKVFQQRFFVDWTYWMGRWSQPPIFVYLGGPTTISPFVGRIAVLNKSAKRYNGLIIYIEHRFYGKSIPLGSIEAAIADPVVRGYLTTEQALADVEAVIAHVTSKISASSSPVIVSGSGYGGALATWFRLTRPKVAAGALASSVPIYSYYGAVPNGICTRVSKDFQEFNPDCHKIIRQSWNAIDEVASQPNGLGILSEKFRICSELNSADELKSLLAHMYIFVAKNNGRYDDLITRVCETIAFSSKHDILDRIAAAFVAQTHASRCHNITSPHTFFSMLEFNSLPWNWQLCNEYSCENNTMGLSIRPFDMSKYISNCEQQYGRSPPRNGIASEYGDLNAILAASSNILFSNGLIDPYSTTGVVKDISSSVVAVNTEQGSYALDMAEAREDDPEWLEQQREKEVEIIGNWLKGSRA